MEFINSYVLFKRKCKKPLLRGISNVYIDKLDNLPLDGEYLVTDKRGRLKVFNCFNGEKRYKAVIKYKLGEEKISFKLKEETNGILIGDKHYKVESSPSTRSVYRIYFHKNQLIESTKQKPSSTCSNNPLQTIHHKVNNWNLLKPTITNRIENNCDCHTRLTYFKNDSFGFIFSYH